MLTDWLIFLDYLEENNCNTSFLRLTTSIIFDVIETHCYFDYHIGRDTGNGFGYDNGYDQGNGYGDGIEDFLYQDHFIEHEIYKDCMEEEH